MGRNIEGQFQTYTLPPLAGDNNMRRLLCICYEYQNLMCCFLFGLGEVKHYYIGLFMKFSLQRARTLCPNNVNFIENQYLLINHLTELPGFHGGEMTVTGRGAEWLHREEREIKAVLNLPTVLLPPADVL